MSSTPSEIDTRELGVERVSNRESRRGDGGELGSTPKTFGVGEAFPTDHSKGLPAETNFGFCSYPQLPFVLIRTDSEELNYETRKSGGRQINQKEASSQTRRSENSGEINPFQLRVHPWLKSNAYSAAGFDFVAVVFRLRGRFRGFGAAPLRTTRTLCSCSEADAWRWRRSLRSLRSCFSCR
jgi:hypothetical protein